MRADANDILIPHICKDAVSNIEFSSNAHYILISAWDGSVSITDIKGVSPEVVFSLQFETPVTTSCFVDDYNIIIGLADGELVLVNPLLDEPIQVRFYASKHAPFKIGYVKQCDRIVMVTTIGEVFLFDHTRLIDMYSRLTAATLSNPGDVGADMPLDPTLTTMELTPIHSLSPRADSLTSVSSCALSSSVLAIAHADAVSLHLITNTATTRIITLNSPFQQAITAVQLILSHNAIVIGGIEGRTAIEPFTSKVTQRLRDGGFQLRESSSLERFAYKCHRVQSKSGTSMYFPVAGFATLSTTPPCFVSGGFDGHIHTWDPIKKKRIASLVSTQIPITFISVSHDATLLAYSTGRNELVDPIHQDQITDTIPTDYFTATPTTTQSGVSIYIKKLSS